MWKFECFLALREPWLVHFCVVVCELFRVFLISCMTAPGHHTKKHPNLVRKFVLALSWLETPIVCVWQSFTQQIQKFRKTDNPFTFSLNNLGPVRGMHQNLFFMLQLLFKLSTECHHKPAHRPGSVLCWTRLLKNTILQMVYVREWQDITGTGRYDRIP